MSKGRKRRQKGEFTRPRHEPPAPGPALPPAKSERLGQVVVVYMMMAGIFWLWEVEDVKDVPILRAANDWLISLSWPQSMEELWSGPPLIERAGAHRADAA